MTKLRDDTGAVITSWALATVALMTLIVGIAVDLSGQLNAKRQAAEVAGQAARSAAQQADIDSYLGGGNIEVSTARAKAAALSYLTAAGMTGTARIEAGQLVVDTTAPYTPRFLSMLGVGNLPVTGTATVRIVRALDGTERR